jgi:hypothetical protein
MQQANRETRLRQRSKAPAWARWCSIVLLGALGACTGAPADRENPGTVYPTNYKAELLAFLRTYLNDPSNIREAAISEPVARVLGTETRYIVCLRYETRRTSGEYAPSRERLAIYYGGRFDRFLESAREQCAAATYQPFPELERLSR